MSAFSCERPDKFDQTAKKNKKLDYTSFSSFTVTRLTATKSITGQLQCVVKSAENCKNCNQFKPIHQPKFLNK